MIISLLICLGVLTFLGFVVWLYLRRPSYTHEKFAFHFITLFFVFTTASIVPLFAGESLFVLLTRAVASGFGMELEQSSNFYDKSLSILVLVILAYVGLRLHGQMTGPLT